MLTYFSNIFLKEREREREREREKERERERERERYGEKGGGVKVIIVF